MALEQTASVGGGVPQLEHVVTLDVSAQVQHDKPRALQRQVVQVEQLEQPVVDTSC